MDAVRLLAEEIAELSKRGGVPTLDADELEPKIREILEDARGRTVEYIRTAMRPISVKEACGEGIWDRAHRSGLQHALNAINTEFARSEAAHTPPQPEEPAGLDTTSDVALRRISEWGHP